MDTNSLLQKLNDLIKPIVDDLCYELYYIEYVRENNENYLRIYIDKQDEKISLSDCEAVSRKVSDMLDVEDPIEAHYYLEVSSPGVYRTLFTDEHYKKVIGQEISLKLSSAVDGSKSYKGVLKAINDDEVIIEKDSQDFSIPKQKIKHANLEGEI